MRAIGKTTTLILAGALALLMAACSPSEPKSKYAGTWGVADTNGAPFDIVLVEDGTATANRAGEAMKGTWKEDGGAAVIEWGDGWVTVISEEDGGYTKKGYDKGVSRDSPPTNTSSATKKN